MQITVITEDRPSSNGQFHEEHGLALYFEWNGKPWLFDTGASDSILDNLKAAHIVPETLYGIVLSHAHNDHAGGLEALLGVNPQVRVWLSREAVGRRCFSLRGEQLCDISMNHTLLERYPDRFIFLEKSGYIEQGMFVLVAQDVPCSPNNQKVRLFTEREGKRVPDDFQHEISLILKDGTRKILLAGCAHRRIQNIVKSARILTGDWPDVIVGGCHLPDSMERVEQQAEELARFLMELPVPPLLFTGHCTGNRAASVLTQEMKERMVLMCCGMKREVSQEL